MEEFKASTKRGEDPLPQLVVTKRKKGPDSATCLNHYTRASVLRLAFDSCLEINSLRGVARLAGTTEPKALDVIRNYVRDLRAMQNRPLPPSGGARRAA